MTNPSLWPDDANPLDVVRAAEAQTFRHSIVHRATALVMIVVGMGFFAVGAFGAPPDLNASLIGPAITVMGVYFAIHLSGTIRVSAAGISRRRLVMREKFIAWAEIDAIREAERYLALSSTRGDEIRISKGLPEFHAVLAAISHFVPVEEHMTAKRDVASAASFAVGRLDLLMWLTYLLPTAPLAVISAIERDERIALVFCVFLAVFIWRAPWFRLEIDSDRFVLRGLFRRVVVNFADVTAIELSDSRTTENGVMAADQIVLKRRNGAAIFFTPRSGAIAVHLRAKSALAEWQICNTGNSKPWRASTHDPFRDTPRPFASHRWGGQKQAFRRWPVGL